MSLPARALDRFGLQHKPSTVDYLLPALGVFGVGVLVGAGVALMLAPKSGAELRGDIGRATDRLRRRVPGSADLEQMTRDELYNHAQDLDIAGRSEMSKAQLADAIRAAS